MEQDFNKIKETEIKSSINDALFKFALTSLCKYMEIKPKNDFVFSPYNIYQGLFSVYLISEGDIKENLKEILYLNKESNDDLIKCINFDKFVQRYLHYRIFENKYVKPDYENLNRCTIINGDFSISLSPMNKIFNNGFVSTNSIHIDDTNRMINEDIQRASENHFCNSVKLKATRNNLINILLMNMNYFHGHNPSIRPSANASPNSAKLMKYKSFFNDELNMHVNQFVITKYITSLYVFFPVSLKPNMKIERDTSDTSLIDLIRRLSTTDGIRKLRNMLDTYMRPLFETCYSTRPIFKIEKDLNARQFLQALNVEQLLLPDPVFFNFTFTMDDQSVNFGNVVHRAHVEVTEDDVKAAAITLITGQEAYLNKSLVEVNYDFPFLWLIYDRTHRDILYIGVFNEFDEPNSQIEPIAIYQTNSPSKKYQNLETF